MQAIYRLTNRGGICRVVNLNNLVGPESAVLFIKLIENLRPISLAIRETVKNRQILTFGKAAEKRENILG